MATFTPFSVGSDRKANALNCIQFQVENNGNYGPYGEEAQKDAAKIILTALEIAVECGTLTEDNSRSMTFVEIIDNAASLLNF